MILGCPDDFLMSEATFFSGYRSNMEQLFHGERMRYQLEDTPGAIAKHLVCLEIGHFPPHVVY